MAQGTVVSLHRWPVKGMAGEQVAALSVDRLGAPGDRTHAVFDVFRDAPRRVTAEQTPRMLAWAAAYPGSSGAALEREAIPEPTVRGPDGATRHWDDPGLPGALEQDLGRPVTLARRPAGQQDRPGTLHVTVDASLRAMEEAVGQSLDLRRFRSNLHLDLDADPYAEEAWTGRRLRVGAAELEVLEGCVRCAVPTRDPDTGAKLPGLLRWLAAERATTFGIIVQAVAPAVVHPGDRVELLS